MRSFAIVCLLAAAVVGVFAESSEELINGKGVRQPLLLSKLIGQDPNGFSIGFGLGLGAEVDDIEAEVDLGPFGFTLDPAPSRKGNKGRNRGSGSAPAPAPAPAPPPCDRHCDPSTRQVCCNTPNGCIANGETVEVCQPPASAYSYAYGRKLQEARDVLQRL
ncbi:hypothetical protein BSKO_10531 [Bryopsis sp. KO-2023]|nr:hypothetical protein BSKO_10531 [Bryopsis sp. KO-2023]